MFKILRKCNLNLFLRWNFKKQKQIWSILHFIPQMSFHKHDGALMILDMRCLIFAPVMSGFCLNSFLKETSLAQLIFITKL